MSQAVVLVTTPDQAQGAVVAEALLSRKLAACVNMLPGVVSRYRWQGAIETATEVLLIIKTRMDLVPALTEAVKAVHQYTVPEIIALPVTGGNAEYLRWIDASTQESPS